MDPGSIPPNPTPVSPLTRNMNRPCRKSDRPLKRIQPMTHEQFREYRRIDTIMVEGDRASTPPRPPVNN